VGEEEKSLNKRGKEFIYLLMELRSQRGKMMAIGQKKQKRFLITWVLK
jgi:hypothetical protein